MVEPLEILAGQAHIPKRVTQHAIFLSGSEAPIVTLKPGQKEPLRHGFYTSETKPLEETYMAHESFKDSVYSRGISKLTQPSDYENPLQSMKPVVSGGKHDTTSA